MLENTGCITRNLFDIVDKQTSDIFQYLSHVTLALEVFEAQNLSSDLDPRSPGG